MDPITLTSVGTVVIAEGIKFLYGQAGELLKRMRERSERGQPAGPNDVQPVQVNLPTEAFDGQLAQPKIHYPALEKVQAELYQLRKFLADYADGLAPVDVTNTQLLAAVDSTRLLLEAVYGQRITFKGESRETSGPAVHGKIDVDKILGEAIAVKARLAKTGSITGRINANEISKDAKATAIELDTIGE